MELNRRTKLVGGVLALAVAALIYDRVIAGGTPATATADLAPPQAEPVLTPATPSQAKAEEKPAHRGALSARLSSLESEFSSAPSRGDAFVAPVAWFPVDDTPELGTKDAPKKTGVHVLTAVMMDKDGKARFAVVDGQRLRPGLPLKCTVDGKTRTYELVKAWVDEHNETHVEILVNEELYELTREERKGKEG